MLDASPMLIRRQDYTPCAYLVQTVDLTFELDPAKTLVINRMQIQRNPGQEAQPLRLHGDDLNLTRVLINGESVSFRYEEQMLVIDSLPDEPFTLEIRNTCSPEKNTQLTGLYTSSGGFFTQCEAQGFRRITYFLDRPDVMAVYTVTLRADKKAYPVLLSNGNLVEEGDLDKGRHYAKWHDPFPKPSYLFALVAADLVVRHQRIRTRSGKDHLLQVYVRRGDLDKTEHAMNSLVASVIWDEARFNLPLDLERFMIVAVSDFNMGAMENKGLNIFNTKYVLANPMTATDADFAGIESVVGHEYFHNWTGNRVTCRDWFQLSLKEGLTVFRDQEFSMDMAGSPSARAVKRIEDVRQLRQIQFPEDAGSMAHPVRPDQYAEINNFYTATIYEKGAEVVRMMQTLVSPSGFAQGMALYFQRHDGQAVTCDDFAQAIADANPQSELALNLEQFKRWYSQAGTPRVKAVGHWDDQTSSYTMTLSQSLRDTPGQTNKLPQVIPIEMGLLRRNGKPFELRLQGTNSKQSAVFQQVLVLTNEQQTYTFSNIDEPPVPSLLRGFSAPVILQQNLSDEELLLLLQHDGDPFNAWEAGQSLTLRRMLAAIEQGNELVLDASYIEAMRSVLNHPLWDSAFKELVLTLPSEVYIAEQLTKVDPQKIHQVRESMKLQLAQALRSEWQRTLETQTIKGAYRPDPVSMGRRALAHLALYMLCLDAMQRMDQAVLGSIYQRFKDATNMTERLGALSALVNAHAPLAELALAQYHEMYKHEALVIDKWFGLQATASEHNGKVFARAKALLHHPDFMLKNPNRVRSLVMALCMGNPAAFHRPDAAGYVFWADRMLELDAINPQVAARLGRVMDRWCQLAEPYRSAAREALNRVASKPNLSTDVREVITRALESET
jgi:aminopeptidase N